MNNETDRATPRPWRVMMADDRPYVSQCDTVAPIYLGEPDPRFIAAVGCAFPADGWGDEDHANAALIVRAVNSHAALVDACALMRERLTILANAQEACWADWPGAYFVDAALALARRERPGTNTGERA